MTIVPDTKDWTWVLDRPCPECGFDSRSFPRENAAPMIRQNASAWQGRLTGAVDPRPRLRPDKWSTLEYGCHVRDVFRIFHERLRLMLTEDDPLFQNWNQDETAVADRYAEQDPATVASQLTEAANSLADELDRVTGEQWKRTGRRSDGANFTVESFARYLVHDPVHHLHDVDQES